MRYRGQEHRIEFEKVDRKKNIQVHFCKKRRRLTKDKRRRSAIKIHRRNRAKHRAVGNLRGA
jgi:hypothetical protein